jgi:hypothetical protein
MSKTKRLLKRLAAERGYTLLRIVDEVEGRGIAPHRRRVIAAPPPAWVPPLERSRYS